MRYWARAIVGALLVIGLSSVTARAQSFGGWLPFRDDKQDTFVHPPTSLGASGAETPAGAASDSATSPSSAAAPPASPSQAATGGTPPMTSSVVPAERTSFFPGFSWPEFQMPYFPKPRMPSLPGRQELEPARNVWVPPSPEPEKPSPWQAVTTGASRVKESTVNTWHKTVDLLTPGSKPVPRERLQVAQREPSMWNRMFSPGSSEPEGPQTVAEWMAQDRIKP